MHYARHHRGDFTRFKMEKYGMLGKEMIEKEQAGIDRMAALLRWIVKLVRDHAEKAGEEGLAGEGQVGLGLVWDGRKFSVAVREGGPRLSAPVIEMIKEARSEA